MTATVPWTAGHIDHPSRQCDGKRTYATRAEARQAARRHVATGHGKIAVYRCPHCASLHLGHPPTGGRARKDVAA